MATPENIRTDSPADSLRRALGAQRTAQEAAREAGAEIQRQREAATTESEPENE